MKLALDHHYSPLIAQQLRQRGQDAVAVSEMGWEAEDDETLFELCSSDGRALLTNNVRDFAVIARRWQADGRSHRGLVFTSDASRPRGRAATGRYVDDLEALLRERASDDAFVDRVHWL